MTPAVALVKKLTGDASTWTLDDLMRVRFRLSSTREALEEEQSNRGIQAVQDGRHLLCFTCPLRIGHQPVTNGREGWACGKMLPGRAFCETKPLSVLVFNKRSPRCSAKRGKEG